MNRAECKKALYASGIRQQQELYHQGVSPLLSREEVEELFVGNRPRSMFAITAWLDNVMVEFYVRDYCFGTDVLPDDFVHCSQVVPFHVVARPGIENGRVDTYRRYLHVNGVMPEGVTTRYIYDFEELLDFLEENNIITKE